MRNEIKILRTKQLCKKLCVGTTTLFTTYMKNPTFPKSIRLGGTNAWYESDIDNWLNSEKQKQLNEEKA